MVKQNLVKLINALRESGEEHFDVDIYEFVNCCSDYVKCTIEMQLLSLLKGSMEPEEYSKRIKDLCEQESSIYGMLESKAAIMNRYSRLAKVDPLFTQDTVCQDTDRVAMEIVKALFDDEG